MITRLLRLAALPVLALALVLGGCDHTQDPTGVAPDQALLLNTATGGTIKLVESKAINTEYMDAWIGPDGGTPQIGPHRLIIPKGAVNEWVNFKATITTTGYIDIKLSATNKAGAAVGTKSKPFLKPLQLRMSYGNAAVPVDPRKLLVTYLVDGTTTGKLEGRTSTIDTTNKLVITSLNHFSRYAVGTD